MFVCNSVTTLSYFDVLEQIRKSTNLVDKKFEGLRHPVLNPNPSHLYQTWSVPFWVSDPTGLQTPELSRLSNTWVTDQGPDPTEGVILTTGLVDVDHRRPLNWNSVVSSESSQPIGCTLSPLYSLGCLCRVLRTGEYWNGPFSEKKSEWDN